jgi:hypothetical protein
MTRGRVSSKVVTLERTATGGPEVPHEVAASPLYGVAMLRIAMELKKADGAPLERLISGVLTRMRLPEADFRSYLEKNGGLLKAIAQSRET